MTTDISTADTTQRATTSVTDWFEEVHPDTTPLVRYGFTQDDGSQYQELTLRSVYEPIPENATTSSAIYFVTDSQLKRLENCADNPFRCKGSGNIAKKIQDECENADRVRYPIYAESDAHEDGVPFTTMIEWIQGFIEETLGVSATECTFWYSGNRSIHVHLSKFLSHSQIVDVREQAKQYCEESGAELDTGIYKAKQMFRLPGVIHRKSAGALQKAQIDPSWENDKIIYASSRDHARPDSYLDMLETTFTPRVDGDEFALTLDAPKGEGIEVPLIEQAEYPEEPYDVPEWMQYNGAQFSPYALAAGNPRSVAALEIKGGAFARKGKRGGAPMVPAYFFGAVGCNGHYTKEAEHAPLQISEGTDKDYEKWIDHGFEAGDYVVIIGGQSRRSIIHSVSKTEALQTGYHLIRSGGGRQAALTYLTEAGYDIGSSGSASHSEGKTTSRSGSRDGEPLTIYSAREETTNEAEQYQWIAENEGVDELSYEDFNLIAHRLLRYGWDPSWEWFKEQFGSEFDPVKTWTQFRSIVEEEGYNEYDDVEVPEKPI